MSKEVLPNYCQIIMVAEREKVDRLVRRQHTRRCPSPVLPQREETRSLQTRVFLRRNILMRSKTACQSRLAM